MPFSLNKLLQPVETLLKLFGAWIPHKPDLIQLSNLCGRQVWLTKSDLRHPSTEWVAILKVIVCNVYMPFALAVASELINTLKKRISARLPNEADGGKLRYMFWFEPLPLTSNSCHPVPEADLAFNVVVAHRGVTLSLYELLEYF